MEKYPLPSSPEKNKGAKNSAIAKLLKSKITASLASLCVTTSCTLPNVDLKITSGKQTANEVQQPQTEKDRELLEALREMEKNQQSQEKAANIQEEVKENFTIDTHLRKGYPNDLFPKIPGSIFHVRFPSENIPQGFTEITVVHAKGNKDTLGETSKNFILQTSDNKIVIGDSVALEYLFKNPTAFGKYKNASQEDAQKGQNAEKIIEVSFTDMVNILKL